MTLQSIQKFIKKQVLAYQAKFAENHFCGGAWFQLTDEEIEVFQILPSDMFSLVIIYDAYLDYKNIQHNDYYDLKAWAVVAQSMDFERNNHLISSLEFQQFAKLFDISNRLSSAMFSKVELWNVRQDITKFADEVGG